MLSRTALIAVFINFVSIPIRIINCFHGYIIIYHKLLKLLLDNAQAEIYNLRFGALTAPDRGTVAEYDNK
ncbi:MAG: hypothetical protein PHN61_15255 [Methanothrix sp.]|nr:hypothetical protein [Methanothrix sp.]